MNALGTRNGKLIVRLRQRFFQRESWAESAGEGALCGLNAGDPAQMYVGLEFFKETTQEPRIRGDGIDWRGCTGMNRVIAGGSHVSVGTHRLHKVSTHPFGKQDWPGSGYPVIDIRGRWMGDEHRASDNPSQRPAAACRC